MTSFGAAFVPFYRLTGPFATDEMVPIIKGEIWETITRRGVGGNLFMGLVSYSLERRIETDEKFALDSNDFLWFLESRSVNFGNGLEHNQIWIRIGWIGCRREIGEENRLILFFFVLMGYCQYIAFLHRSHSNATRFENSEHLENKKSLPFFSNRIPIFSKVDAKNQATQAKERFSSSQHQCRAKPNK